MQDGLAKPEWLSVITAFVWCTVCTVGISVSGTGQQIALTE